MRTLLIGTGTLLLLLGAAWLMLRGVDSAPPTAPTLADAPRDPDAAPKAVAQPMAPPEPEAVARPPLEPAPESVAPPPLEPAPAENDIAKRVLTLRMVDADRELPIARTMFALSPVDLWLDENGQVQRSTLRAVYTPGLMTHQSNARAFLAESEESGLIRFLVVTPSEPLPPQFQRVIWSPTRIDWRLPTPEGMAPAFTLKELGQEIGRVFKEPRSTAIDVRWRRAPSMTGVVRAEAGHPVAGAVVIAIAKSSPPELADWARFTNHLNGRLWSAQDPGRELETLLEELGKAATTRREGGLTPRFDTGNYGAIKADDAGRFIASRLFRGDWVFCVFHPCFEPYFETMHLGARDHHPTFTLKPNGTASLRVVADVIDGSVPTKAVYMAVQIGGPWGTPWWGLMQGATHNLPENTLELHGLAPAFYTIRMLAYGEDGDFECPASTAIVELKPGESREVVLKVGSGAMATWEPVTMAGTTPSKGVWVRLRGGPFPRGTDLALLQQEGEVNAVKLPPGEYTAELAGLAPFHFTLAPGQNRRDVFQIPLFSTSFEVSADVLAAMGNTRQASLTLIADDSLPVDQEALCEANNVLRLGLDFTPGAVRQLRLPVGRYQWTLDSFAREELSGTLTVTSTGTNHFQFTAESMPGAARLDVDVSAYVAAGVDVPSLELSDTAVRGSAIGFWHLPRWGFVSWAMREAPQARVDLRPGKTRFFAAPGRWLLSVGGTQMLVTLPGSVTLTPGDRRPDASLRWVSADEAAKCTVEVIDSSGLAMIVTRQFDTPVFSGRVRVSAQRKGPGGGMQAAALTLGVGAGPQELNIDELEWQDYGSFTLECQGRGSPEAAHDAWWMYSGDHDHDLVVEMLDRTDATGTPVVVPEIDSKWHPGSRLAFRFLEHPVPPGRYRVIPWPGAPERYCVTFEVKPGENTEVLVKGG